MVPPAEDVFTYETAFAAHAESLELTSGPKTSGSVHWTPFSSDFDGINRHSLRVSAAYRLIRPENGEIYHTVYHHFLWTHSKRLINAITRM